MTEENKLAERLEHFAKLLRSGEWGAVRWRWAPEGRPVSVSAKSIEDKALPKSEAIFHEFEFSIIKNTGDRN